MKVSTPAIPALLMLAAVMLSATPLQAQWAEDPLSFPDPSRMTPDELRRYRTDGRLLLGRLERQEVVVFVPGPATNRGGTRNAPGRPVLVERDDYQAVLTLNGIVWTRHGGNVGPLAEAVETQARETMAYTKAYRDLLTKQLQRVEAELEASPTAGNPLPRNDADPASGLRFDPEDPRSVRDWIDAGWRLSFTLTSKNGSGIPGAPSLLDYRGRLEVNYVSCREDGAGRARDVRVRCDLDGLFYPGVSMSSSVPGGFLEVSGTYDDGHLVLVLRERQDSYRLRGQLWAFDGHASGSAEYTGANGSYDGGNWRAYR